jgi:hypothetical protein
MAGSDGVDVFFANSCFIVVDAMSRPDQRSVRASWTLCGTGEAAHHQTSVCPTICRKIHLQLRKSCTRVGELR